jgi:hypothetical protein
LERDEGDVDTRRVASRRVGDEEDEEDEEDKGDIAVGATLVAPVST